jgi:hypothetical protein
MSKEEADKLDKLSTNRSSKSLKSQRSATVLQEHQQQIQKEQLEKQHQKEKQRSTILRSIKNLFLRASLSLSILSHRLRQFAEEALSSDEVVNELFLVTSSSSVDLSVLEQSPAQSPPEDTTSNTVTMTLDKEDTKDVVAWPDFDAVQEAQQLRVEGEPFINGRNVWDKRRAAWTAGTREEKLVAKQRAVDNSLTVPKENYPVVYSSLVERNKTLKKPMNLKDALNVINAGWLANKKWERAAQGLG